MKVQWVVFCLLFSQLTLKIYNQGTDEAVDEVTAADDEAATAVDEAATAVDEAATAAAEETEETLTEETSDATLLIIETNTVIGDTSVVEDSDSGTRILTIGYGTFTIILGVFVSLGISFFVGRSSRYPELVFFFSLIIPFVLVIFFVFAPKEADKRALEQASITTNPWLVLQVFAIIIAILTFLLAGLYILSITFFRGIKAIRISSQLEMERDKKKNDKKLLDQKKNKKDNDDKDEKNDNKDDIFKRQ